MAISMISTLEGIKNNKEDEEYQLKKLEIEKETKRGICIPLEEQILESPKSDELIEEKSLGEEDKE